MGICFSGDNKLSKSPIRLHMSFHIWNKESFGLFNVKAGENDITIRDYYLTNSKVIYGDILNDQAFFTNTLISDPTLSELRTVIINIHHKENPINYVQAINESNMQSKNLWTLCDSNYDKIGDLISKDDVFRVGRQVFRFSFAPEEPQKQTLPKTNRTKIHVLHTEKSNIASVFEDNFEEQKENKPKNENTMRNTNLFKSIAGTSVFCRICLEPETEQLRFEKNLCFCSQNMPAHVECIMKWMNKKCEKWKKNGVAFYDLSLLYCDVCRSKYPTIIKTGNKERQILDIKFSKNVPHAIIESYENESQIVNGYFIIEMEKDKDRRFFIGRHDQNEISFKDISVSRQHACINWSKNKLYIKDLDSKFGTLKMAKGRQYLDDFQSKRFVIDKFMFYFHIFKSRDKCDCFEEKSKIIKNPNDSIALKAYIELKNNSLQKVFMGVQISEMDIKEIPLPDRREDLIAINEDGYQSIHSPRLIEEQLDNFFTESSEMDEDRRENQNQDVIIPTDMIEIQTPLLKNERMSPLEEENNNGDFLFQQESICPQIPFNQIGDIMIDFAFTSKNRENAQKLSSNQKNDLNLISA